MSRRIQTITLVDTNDNIQAFPNQKRAAIPTVRRNRAGNENRRMARSGDWEKVDETHVKSKLGPLSLRPGFHSTQVPYTDWIGKRGSDGSLFQRPDTVWCECQVEGERVFPEGTHGMRTLPEGWYYFRTKPNQPFLWIISDRILIRRMLEHCEVEALCWKAGVKAQPLWAEEE